MPGPREDPMADPMADPMGAPMGADPIAIGAQLASCRSLPHSHASGWKAPASSHTANMGWVKSRVLKPQIAGTVQTDHHPPKISKNVAGLKPFPHGKLVGSKETPE